MAGYILTELSPEILHNLFFFLEAVDLSRLSRTCHLLRDFIARDDLLWKRVYLTTFDEPRHAPESWQQALQDSIYTDKLLDSQDHDLKRREWLFLAKQFLRLIMGTTQARPLTNTTFLASQFHHATRRSNASTLLRQSSLFRRCGTPYDDPAESVVARQLSARLHVYSALPLELRESEYIEMQGAQYLHPFARSRLYDLRRYKTANFWGPFMDDGSGRIDWEKVQNIYIVLGYGLRMLSERTGNQLGSSVSWGMGLNGSDDHEMFQGLAPQSYRSRTEDEALRHAGPRLSAAIGAEQPKGTEVGEDGVPSLEWFEEHYRDRKEAKFQYDQAVFATQDPYGVKGVWMRIVNFLDYHDLFALNFTGDPLPEHFERDPVTTAEAYRLILLKLWITDIEWPDENEGQAEDWETVDGSEPSTPGVSQEHDRQSGCSTPTPVTMDDANREPAKKSKYPIVKFEGRSRSLHIRWDPNANSHIRGSHPFYSVIGQVRAYPAPAVPKHEFEADNRATPNLNLSHVYLNQAQQGRVPSYSSTQKVSSEEMTGLKPEDDLVIRWTTWSVFGGEERWRSEGVQIGGLKSARGILGNWFDKDFDRHGPAGPTGFWKMGDDATRYGPESASRRLWADEDD